MPYILNRNDVYNLAGAIGAQVHEKGPELFFSLCPYCNGGESRDKNTFSINLGSGAFKCFRASCGKEGHFVELARDFNYPLDFGEDTKQKVYRPLPQKPIHTSCSAIDYLKSRGISESVTNRYHITTQKGNPGILVFPFYDENNKLVFVKYRNTKFQKGQGSKEWCEEGTKPILFGMDQCSGFERLIITEGQIDSLTLAECGLQNAVSVPTGAKGFTWLSNVWEWIIRFHEIIVFGDFEHGKMTLIDELLNKLPKSIIIKAVQQKDYLDKKDANDIFRAYGKQAILKAVNDAQRPPVERVKDLADVERIDLYRLPKIKTFIPELDRILSGGIFFGQLLILTGKRGEGKSTFMSQIVAASIEQDYPVFVYSGELADYHFKNWLDLQIAGEKQLLAKKLENGDTTFYISPSAAAKISNWYRGKAYIYDNGYVGEEMEDLLATVEKAVCRYGVRLVCIDNLMTAMDVTAKDNLYQAQSDFVKKLKTIAVKYDIAVVLVSHPRKTGNEVTNDDVSGSADITNRADIVLSYSRNWQKQPQDLYSPDSSLAVNKNRITGKTAFGDKAIPLFFSPNCKRIDSESTLTKPIIYNWNQDDSPIFINENEWETIL